MRNFTTVILISAFGLTACGPIAQNYLEGLPYIERKQTLMGMNNEELCDFYTNSYVKENTEAQILRILRERKVDECRGYFTVRPITPKQNDQISTQKTDKVVVTKSPSEVKAVKNTLIDKSTENASNIKEQEIKTLFKRADQGDGVAAYELALKFESYTYSASHDGDWDKYQKYNMIAFALYAIGYERVPIGVAEEFKYMGLDVYKNMTREEVNNARTLALMMKARGIESTVNKFLTE